MTGDQQLSEEPSTDRGSNEEAATAETPAAEETPGADGTAEGDDRSHLTDIEDGAGCTEIWERLSERRDGDADEKRKENR